MYTRQSRNAPPEENNQAMKDLIKETPAVKTCGFCGQSFSWQKKWEKVWDEMQYCSERCRRKRKTHLLHVIQKSMHARHLQKRPARFNPKVSQ